jgi:hypothetical protein
MFWRKSQHIEGEIQKLRLEGWSPNGEIPSTCLGERTAARVTIKFSPRQEFVVGGYKPNASHFGTILVGYFEKRTMLA